jgi:DNA-binding response OmpR family regulator
LKNLFKILILDDSNDLLDALKLFLEKQFLDVVTVNSYASLKVELTSFKPELILLDVFINGISEGREICKAIKYDKATCHIPIILMSASPNNLIDYEECNADSIIEKPFNISKLIEKILLYRKDKNDLQEEKIIIKDTLQELII